MAKYVFCKKGIYRMNNVRTIFTEDLNPDQTYRGMAVVNPF